jgi:hypothetical protein
MGAASAMPRSSRLDIGDKCLGSIAHRWGGGNDEKVKNNPYHSSLVALNRFLAMLRCENRSTKLPTPARRNTEMSRKKSTAVAEQQPTVVADKEPNVDKPALELTARERTVFEKYREIHSPPAATCQ